MSQIACNLGFSPCYTRCPDQTCSDFHFPGDFLSPARIEPFTWEKPWANGCCMETTLTSEYASDLRFALDVLDEYSHLGLDDQYATQLREILERRICEAEDAPSCSSAQPVRFPVAADQDE
jgi:hypothetical protein